MSNSTKYSDEGTIAHELAAMCLREKKPASAYVGRLIQAEEYEHAQLSASTAHRWMRCPGSYALESRQPFKPRRFSHQVDEEMAGHVQTYLDNIERRVFARNAELEIEIDVPIGHITGEEGATGRADAIIIDHAAYELCADDLKYGAGVMVPAQDNEQLQLYLLGALESFGEFYEFHSFRGTIHQPRIREEPSTDTWSREELEDFGRRARAGAQLARSVKENSAQGNIMDHAQLWVEQGLNILVPGDKQCQFCSAKAVCPALQKTIKDNVLSELGDDALERDAPPPERPAGEPPVTMADLVAIPADNAKLARLKRFTPLLRAWCDAVDSHTEAEILAGRPVPGFKAVAGRKGNRAWKDPEDAEATLKAMRLKREEMYDLKLISPTTAEKLVKSGVLGERQWAKLQEKIGQAPGKPTVVPEDDNRPALAVVPVSQELSDNGDDIA